MKELSDDRSLERFKIEYEKLFKALKKSHGQQHHGGNSSYNHAPTAHVHKIMNYPCAEVAW